MIGFDSFRLCQCDQCLILLSFTRLEFKCRTLFWWLWFTQTGLVLSRVVLCCADTQSGQWVNTQSIRCVCVCVCVLLFSFRCYCQLKSVDNIVESTNCMRHTNTLAFGWSLSIIKESTAKYLNWWQQLRYNNQNRVPRLKLGTLKWEIPKEMDHRKESSQQVNWPKV